MQLLILSCGLLNCLNQKRSYFLEQVLKPPENVVILLCGVENSEILYEILILDGGSKEISTHQKPEEYISVVAGIIQPDHQTSSAINLSDVRAASEKTDLNFKNEVLSERLETSEQSILVLPGRISYENPGEIFILLKDEVDGETVDIEFIADNQRIRTQTASWNKKVKYVKALGSHLEEFPTLLHCAAGFGLKNLAVFLLSCPEAIQACKITNKYGDDPESITGKYGHKELRKLIKELSINAANNFTNCKEEAEDSDTYELILGSEIQPAMVLKAKQNPGDQSGIGSRCQQEAEVDEEKKADVKESREETEHEDQQREDSYSFHNSPDNLYVNILDDLKENRRDCFFCKRPPPPPPRNLSGVLGRDDLHNFSQERNFVMDRNKKEHDDGLKTACYREDQDTCEEDSKEEHPYTSVKLDESVYEFILEEEERRNHFQSFVMNRPPAPAPHPICLPVREENTPYIVQVFQQKATRVTNDNNRTYCNAKKPAHRGHTDTVTYSTVKHIPAEQEELIHLQEEVKKGAISVDKALDQLKQWQKEKERLQPT